MTRTEYLTEYFNGWLDRYAPPRFLADKPERMQQEADTLLRIIARYAPTQGYAEWLDGVLRALTEGMTARTWPTGGELSKACRDASRNTGAPQQATTQRDSAQIEANRMNTGQPVGEGWLYGTQACELIARGLVDQPTMERYRRAAFNARANLYGDDAALRWEAEARGRHEAAKAAWHDRGEGRQHRPTVATGNRMPAGGDFT